MGVTIVDEASDVPVTATEIRMHQAAYADKWRRHARLQHVLDTLMPPIGKPMTLKQVLRTSTSVYAINLAEQSREYMRSREAGHG